MPFSKQDFYEGAALRLLLRRGTSIHLRYEAPCFIVNDHSCIYLKYRTNVRSPWGFSFGQAERLMLRRRAKQMTLAIGLVCGGDGVAGIKHEEFAEIAGPLEANTHIACYRRKGEHYAVSGPTGELSAKVPPSRWQLMLDGRG